VFDFDFDLTLNDAGKRDELHRKSPIYYIDQVKAPLLFLVGAVDLRVPPLQSVEYYKALKQRNKETE
jgi:dipeptidyl aminopeptidase/acylaminoacyl peptidase